MRGSTQSRSLRAVLPVLFVSIVGLTASPAILAADCDWQPGQSHKMHWPQLPDLTSTGTDVSLSSAALADDFLCTASGPIRNIHIWASFLGDNVPKEGPANLTLELSLYANIPSEGPKWGQPGELLWSQSFSPGQYTVQTVHNGPEDWYDPSTGLYLSDHQRQAYQYDFCVQDEPFVQQEGTTYWLAVSVTELSPNYALGWKTTSLQWQWNNSAVSLAQDQVNWTPMDYPDGHEYDNAPVGLAFVIDSGDDTTPQYDLGDAPDSTGNFPAVKMLAYPGGMAGSFPTVYQTGSPPHGPLHQQPRDAFYLGTRVSLESEADLGPDDDGINNLDPSTDTANQDGADDGLELPVIMPHLGLAAVDYTVTRTSYLAKNAYVNVWCDWNRDGDWNDTIIATDGTLIPEWAVQDHQPTIPGIGTYTFISPSFTCWHPEADDTAPIWVRITISEQRWQDVIAAPRVGGAGPADGYLYECISSDAGNRRLVVLHRRLWNQRLVSGDDRVIASLRHGSSHTRRSRTHSLPDSWSASPYSPLQRVRGGAIITGSSRPSSRLIFLVGGVSGWIEVVDSIVRPYPGRLHFSRLTRVPGRMRLVAAGGAGYRLVTDQAPRRAPG